MSARKPKFHVGQVVVLRESREKIPTRILAKKMMSAVWYYEISFHTGHYNECVFRPLTKREHRAGKKGR